MKTLEAREYVYISLIVVLALALVVVALLGAWGLQVWGTSVNYERLAYLGNAISGPATFLAFGAAVIAIGIERLQRWHEEKRQRDERATAVVFWFTVTLIQYDNGAEEYRWAVEIENGTRAPVFRWRLAIEGHPDAAVCNHQKQPLLPGRNTFNVELRATAPNAMPQGTLVFLDRYDRIWCRAIEGELTRKQVDAKVCEHE